MINVILASLALLGTTALAGNQGSAIVVNKCSYNVQLDNTPSDDGVHTAIDQTLSPGGSYSQQYTQLNNNNGWSLKLSKPDDPSDLLQYEYTYHADGTIWYDLSEVNGNPWDGNWEITATGGCSPRQAAYRFATDDAYGMQACDDTASITVTLCSGNSAGGSQGPAPSSPPETSWGAAPTSAAPTSAAPAPSNTWGGHSWGVEGNKVESPAGNGVEDKKAPSTLVTTSVPWNGPAVTVTNLAFETVTQIVTATGHGHHKHHARHPHHLRI